MNNSIWLSVNLNNYVRDWAILRDAFTEMNFVCYNSGMWIMKHPKGRLQLFSLSQHNAFLSVPKEYHVPNDCQHIHVGVIGAVSR